MLEEVVVSSRKLGDERLQDVPQSILAISSKQIQDFAIGSFDDYARLVPSLSSIDQGPGQSKLVLRGVSTGFTRADQVQDGETSGLYVDETPIAINGSNPDFSLFDVERIEVLRGPQGTLYGVSDPPTATTSTVAERVPPRLCYAKRSLNGCTPRHFCLPLATRAHDPHCDECRTCDRC